MPPDPTHLRAQAVEAMARAAEPAHWSETVENFIRGAESDEPADGRFLRQQNEANRQAARDRSAIQLTALLAFLAERGWQIVPKVATEEMADDGLPAAIAQTYAEEGGGYSTDADLPSAVWTAMLASAPSPLEAGDGR